jgi:hypothetical protein
MRTYKRICIEDYSLSAQNGDSITLKRGAEYITSDVEDGLVTVFTNFWVPVPVSVFAGAKIFT